MRLPVLIGAVTLALVGAGNARADHLLPIPPSSASPVVNNVGGSGGSYRITGAAQAAIAVRGYDPLAAPWSPGGTNSIPANINRMQRAGRILPALSGTFGSILLTGGAFYAATKIGDGLGNYIYRELAGEPVTTASTLTNVRWICVGGTAAGCETSLSHDAGTFSSGWFLRANEASRMCGWMGTTNCSAVGLLLYDVAEENGLYTGYLTHSDVTGGGTGCSTGSASCALVTRTNAQMDAATEMTPITQSEYEALTPGDHVTNVTYAAPGGLGSNADNDASGAVLVEPDGTQDPGQQATEEAICEDLFPGECVRSDNIDLPAPQPNETYTDYMARLAALGHVGTITTVEEALALPAYGPSAVTRVTIQTTPARVLDPNNWPSTAPAVAPAIELTLRYNPATATPVPTEGGTTTTPGTTTVTGVPTTIPAAPAIDFEPLTGIDFGCKFPYGFLTCYAIGFTELFEVTEDAPVFSFQLGWTGMVNGQEEGGEAPYVVDLDVLDDYMSLWRTILSVCLWVGAIYFVATRFLGFKAGGDPGEAIEDVL